MLHRNKMYLKKKNLSLFEQKIPAKNVSIAKRSPPKLNTIHGIHGISAHTIV